MQKTSNRSLVLLLTIGVFGILNTEMGITGILPHISEQYGISLTTASLLVSGFALVVAIAGPTMPLLFSKVNRRSVMLLATGAFALSTIVSIFAPNFTVLLIARVLPAIFHPVYVSMAMTVAATSVSENESQKAVAQVFMGVSAGTLLGVPVSNFLASQFSLSLAMLFFAVINLLVFIGTIVLVPSLPVTRGLSYGQQLSILKRKTIWISIISVILLNGAVLGFNSYMSDFLATFSQINVNLIALVLLSIGLANIIGNALAGKFLDKNAHQLLISLPLVLIINLALLFFFGNQAIAMMILVVIFGMFGGLAGNVNQYMIYSVGDDAPDFANGLFLAAANLGVTVGTSFTGKFIDIGNGSQFSIWGSIIMLLFAFLTIQIRQKWLSNK
ncbi:MFS transporter [Streptococcus equinus]|uniref:MFS transporter n=1 Tax=Streptococcus equinus TaxID=1335 RepID=UPI0008C3B643|nr:MFS transporter [Streptococcus equinus]SEI79629.1 Predicted arabinose efflux permease, MFS family [Streptococcus equinus]